MSTYENSKSKIQKRKEKNDYAFMSPFTICFDQRTCISLPATLSALRPTALRHTANDVCVRHNGKCQQAALTTVLRACRR